jgi:hypothetical protein
LSRPIMASMNIIFGFRCSDKNCFLKQGIPHLTLLP